MFRSIFKILWLLFFGILITGLYLFTFWTLAFDWVEGLFHKDQK